jgi:lysophospholipase L1-like esterase
MTYTLVALSLALVTVFAILRISALLWAAVFVLAATVVFLDYRTRKARDRESVGATGPGDRVAFAALLLLVAGIVLVVAFFNPTPGVDAFFFIGLSGVLIAGGMLYSELRRSSWPGAWRGPLLLGAGGALFVVTMFLPPGWSFVSVFLVAVIVGELGTELLSEDSLTWTARPAGPALAVRGALLLVVAVGLLVAIGTTPTLAIVLVAVLGVVVLFAAMDSDALIIVVLVALALALAIDEPGQDLDQETTAVAGEPYFLVLGDSYISGEGAQEFVDGTNEKEENRDRTNECRQATTAWPFLLARAGIQGVPKRLLFLGCSGAVTENIHTEPRREKGTGEIHGPAELALFEQQRPEDQMPQFVLVSIGGNDAGFGEIGETCVGPGNCAEVAQQFLDDNMLDRDGDGEPDRAAPAQPDEGGPGKGRPEDLAHISDDLDAAYERIAAAVGDDVPVIAVPYPSPFANAADCQGVLLSTDERQFVSGFLDELDRAVEQAAQRHGFMYLSRMKGALRDEGAPLCGGSKLEVGLNFLKLNPKVGSIFDSLNPANWTHNSLHPNEHGHVAMAAAATKWFREHPNIERGAKADEPVFEVQTLKKVMEDRVVTQCGDAPSCRVGKRTWLYSQSHALWQRALAPLALVMIGWALVVLPGVWWGRDRGFSIAYLISEARKRLG